LQRIQDLKEKIQQEKEFIQEKKETLKAYKEKLSEYNLIKDVTQEILGKIASNENTTISNIYEKFDMNSLM
jgi:gas vesicle protein